MKTMLRKIYNILPFKRFFFTHFKSFFLNFPELTKHLWFKGPFEVNVGKDSFKMINYNSKIETVTFWNGYNAHEPMSMKIWSKLSEHSKNIFDIGANTGIYSLIAKSVNPEGQVYAFEALPRVFFKLKKNVDLNGFDIRAFNLGVSDSAKQVELYDLPNQHHNRASLVYNEVKHIQGIYGTNIFVKPVHSIVQENNIPNLDLVKIDVEGGEENVLEGCADLIEKFRPIFLIEAKTVNHVKKINQYFFNLFYFLFIVDEHDGLICYKENFKFFGRNIIMIPKEKKYIIDDFLTENLLC